ncbi:MULTISPECIES: tyrosine-type recombinase/integrase [Curtobacterium]|uniref:tyrosine-type recombinase/integrase n=1 Tax=Curtobacterium flaccumfaciens TaxID=2035 RepID=UPI003EE4910D
MNAIGRVVEVPTAPRYRLIFPEAEQPTVTLYLRDLAASQNTAGTIRSYAYDLLKWFRFLHERGRQWDRAERVDVRDFVEMMQITATAAALRRAHSGPSTTNQVTGKRKSSTGHASASINHALSVVSSFYEFVLERGEGPLVNPVPRQRGGSPNAHQVPDEPFRVSRRGKYRQKTPRPQWKAIPDDAVSKLFAAARNNRDRALLSFWLSTGVRARELLDLRHGDYDFGMNTITVTSKGTGARDTVPASPDAFMWLDVYMKDGQPIKPGQPVWWTLAPKNRRPLQYDAALRMFQRLQRDIGSDWTLHALRHTAAERMINDPAYDLAKVAATLRHANVNTTTIYTQPRVEDLVQAMLAHYSRPAPPPPTVGPSYDADAVRELLGFDE